MENIVNGFARVLTFDGRCGIFPISFGKIKQMCKFPFIFPKQKINCSVGSCVSEVWVLSPKSFLPCSICSSSLGPVAFWVSLVSSTPCFFSLMQHWPLNTPASAYPLSFFFWFSCYLDKVRMCCGWCRSTWTLSVFPHWSANFVLSPTQPLIFISGN